MAATGSTHHHPRPPPTSQNTRTPSVAVFGWDERAAPISQWEGAAAGDKMQLKGGWELFFFERWISCYFLSDFKYFSGENG